MRSKHWQEYPDTPAGLERMILDGIMDEAEESGASITEDEARLRMQAKDKRMAEVEEMWERIVRDYHGG